jgi:hypothetical protein
MAFHRDAVIGSPLAQLYRKSRKCFWFESLLAYNVRKKVSIHMELEVSKRQMYGTSCIHTCRPEAGDSNMSSGFIMTASPTIGG